MNTQNPLLHLSVEKLKQVIGIRQQIEGLQEQLAGLANSNPPARMEGVGHKKMSHAARAKISAAAKARWAKIKSDKRGAAKGATRRKFTVSAATRERIAAAARARWAKAKAAGKKSL